MIQLENVVKILGTRRVLDGVNLEVRKGETLVIVGPSGTGKSVTLKNMVRLMTPDEGRVVVDGMVVSEASGKALESIRDKFGVLFQGGALLEWLNVAENVALPLREKTQLSNDEIMEKVMEKLAMVGLEKDIEKFPSEISGGMRKRVGLARAIVTNPQIILYDEPTSGLDPVSSRMIDRLIDHLRNELGVTSVVVTHDLHSALSIGTRIAMLTNGKIIELATPEDFVKSQIEEVRQFLEAQFITVRGEWEKSGL
ncbi:MAG: ABC transporter ATP-binding protein [bacterium]|jgi:phospholipid/cholesterol/gamma-HCH transport system ATP-binding protein